ncbi:MAG: glycosyltransferase family 2 protein, partial [Candidatus Hydrogenedentes bacterium]|nr:glycosyltransferase family 2 protein [Candidatus Hydrogenedentota bacterium]
MNADTLILLPAHNEAGHIEKVIAAVRDVCGDAPIAVVDDGSKDATAARARAAGAVVLPLPFNMGYGVALQTGYKYALHHGFEYLVQLDSDGQHEPTGIPRLLDRVRAGSCDLCIGSRFLEGDTYAVPPLRRAGMILFRRVASALVGQTITDPTSGFQAMNRKVLAFFCRDVYPVDYPDTDVIVMLHHHGFRIAEAPVVMYPAPSGKSIHAG